MNKTQPVGFYFLRHGQTDHNRKKVFAMFEDLPINEHGAEQIREIAPHIASLQLTKLWYSPLRRAIETKEILVPFLPTAVDYREMATIAECPARLWRVIAILPKDHALAHSYLLQSVVRRVRQTWQQLATQESAVLLVSHLGIYWIFCSLLKIDPPWPHMENGMLMHFYYHGDAWHVRVHNASY